MEKDYLITKKVEENINIILHKKSISQSPNRVYNKSRISHYVHKEGKTNEKL